jgi:putative alpha-1,2-mannosidase
MKIGTSYMSVEQAQKNLHLEVLQDDLDFDKLLTRATDK